MIKVQHVSLGKENNSCYCEESKITPFAMSKYLYLLLAVLLAACRFDPKNYEMVKRQPNIFPDYTNVVVPPNIAPLNFYINDPADHYRIKISSLKGKAIEISQSSPSVIIPIILLFSITAVAPNLLDDISKITFLILSLALT